MEDTKEIRSNQGKFEVRQGEGEPDQLEGYSALFNSPTVIWGLFTESIHRDAFNGVLSRTFDTRALFDHDPSKLLARVGNGTLDLVVDDKGLFARIRPNMSVSWAKDVVELVKRGDLYGQSFAFTIKKEAWTLSNDQTQMDHREILEIGELYDVGPVTYPAYERTSIEVKEQARAILRSARENRSDAVKKEGVYVFENSLDYVHHLQRKLQLES